jgi:hypothetical protein
LTKRKKQNQTTKQPNKKPWTIYIS